jgi:hypothetical protein
MTPTTIATIVAPAVQEIPELSFTGSGSLRNALRGVGFILIGLGLVGLIRFRPRQTR